MAKYTCLDCKYYCPENKVYDGLKPIMPGVCVPKEKIVKHFCTKHQDVFVKWWNENGKKHRADVTEVPECLELNNHLAALNKANQFAIKILDDIEACNKKNRLSCRKDIIVIDYDSRIK